jgi:hypothetical protein
MPKMWKDMSKEERASLVEGAVRDSSGGISKEDPMYKEAQNRVSNKGWNYPMIPKVDPEVEANTQINKAVSAPGVVIPSASNGINPETGMPFFSKQEVSPEEAKRNEELAMKTEFLRRRSQGQ